MTRYLAVSVVLGMVALAVSSPAGPPPRELRAFDVCTFAAGADVIRVVGGSLLDTKRFNAPDGTIARCNYGVALPGKGNEKERTVWVVELSPPADFDELRPHIDEPVRDVAGVGDGAYEYKSADTGRWRIYTRKPGDVTISVTGSDESIVRKLAAYVLSRLNVGSQR
jgi:hypothetical protein